MTGQADNPGQADSLGMISVVVMGQTDSSEVDGTTSGGAVAACTAQTHNMATLITGRASVKGTTSMVVSGQTGRSETASLAVTGIGRDYRR